MGLATDELSSNLRQVRNALVYVLHNAKHHGEELPAWANGIDPYSSAYYFRGWSNERFGEGLSQPHEGEPPVAPAETWFLTTGWKRYGLIGLDEAPADTRR